MAVLLQDASAALLHLPSAIKILAIFTILVLAVSRGVHLGLAAALGAFAAALWSGASVSGALSLPLRAALSPASLLLALVLVLILGLSSLMKSAGAMDRVAEAYGALARSPSLAVATLPGIVAALPMPGGAAFSAPMVAALDPEGRLSPPERSAANYFFRHTVELLWPLYPAFILVSSLAGLGAGQLAALNSYSTPVLLAAGWFFLLRRPLAASRSGAGPSRRASRPAARRRAALVPFLRAFAPVLATVAVAALLSPLATAFADSRPSARSSALVDALVRYLPIIVGIVVGTVLIVTAWIRRSGGGARPGAAPLPAVLFRAFLAPSSLSTALMVLGIVAFSGTLDRLGLAASVAKELGAMGIGNAVLAGALPFLAGLVTGVGFGYVGVAFPIVLSLVPQGQPIAHIVVLANAAGYAGMMLSPLHICAAVSSGFFGVALSDTLRRVVPPVLTLLAAAILYSSILAYSGL